MTGSSEVMVVNGGGVCPVPCVLFLLGIWLATATGCGRSDAYLSGHEPPPTNGGPSPAAGESNREVLFADVTEEWGLSFVHDCGRSGSYFMPRTVGSGAALLDYDGDGRLDIYLIQNGGPDSGSTNRLFRQAPEGRFVDVSQGCGLDVAGYGMGVAVGDVNNDGRVDVLLTEYGRLRLFANRSHGPTPRFIDVTDQAGLESLFWGTSTCFFDYDRDGWLDLVVVNYVNYDPSRWCADAAGRQEFCGPDAFRGRFAKLFHNLGPQGEENAQGGRSDSKTLIRFEDVTVASGFVAHPGPGLGVFCADFDGDRWADVFVANDGKPNHLWINQHDGTFREEALERGIGYNGVGESEADMGVAIGDVDGDANFDLFVTHLTSETHTLWMQHSRGFFEDRTVASGLTAWAWQGTGFGTVMADFDNDGALDLGLANGRVRRAAGVDPPTSAQLDPFWIPYSQRDQLLLNDGKGRFFDVSEANAAFAGEAAVSRGLACGDIDDDGAVDLLVTRIAAPARLYRNVAPQRGHWLMIRAIDPALQREAYGAEVYVRAGERRLMRWINPGYSYLCSNDSRAHFGLGEADRVDAIEVIWPDGGEETFPGGAADRLVVLRRGEGRPNSE